MASRFQVHPVTGKIQGHPDQANVNAPKTPQRDDLLVDARGGGHVKYGGHSAHPAHGDTIPLHGGQVKVARDGSLTHGAHEAQLVDGGDVLGLDHVYDRIVPTRPDAPTAHGMTRQQSQAFGDMIRKQAHDGAVVYGGSDVLPQRVKAVTGK